MKVFVAHPSVRMRGAEHAYTPLLCQDEKCLWLEQAFHMHCPLCSITDAYQDPVILRAHFRIKHVDKSLDFAGLKVLRCCNHCEIVGTIKGEKRFKGAHWHCYCCRNGFKRRDEAVKHFKTHFRNPHTTFQIQVTQNVNCRQYYGQSSEAHAKAYAGQPVDLGKVDDATGIGSILTATLTTGTEALLTVEPKQDVKRNGILLGDDEEGSSTEGTQTLVLFEPDGQENHVILDTAVITQQEEDLEHTLLQKQLLEVHQQIASLRQEKDIMEKTLQAEIKQLKEQVASLVQSNVRMFEELQTYQCPDHSRQEVNQLMENLQVQHKKLLQAQLESLRRELLSKNATNGQDSELKTKSTVGALTRHESTEEQLHTHLRVVKSTNPEMVMSDSVSCLESPGLSLEMPNSHLTTSTVLEEKRKVASSLVSSRKHSSADDSEGQVESKRQRVS
ncbi:hypothetical protein DNTS_003151 [Danionella cerebrum]|uniref:C2H2-type domain-containing protein n=1 Tax=Danionella cerebrum TaxID=2873325 RepID=A0A553N5Y2_9TELE|nr:hypothetical protein DNTS_003151 [Danionella translucida]